MYNPSRGGVRGGADQFTWESVKNDKHRENYLGHSLKAPVGRWQKGKDLSWYAKERKENAEKSDESVLASIKRAEEEAMLIALGHNIVRKTETLSKEDIQEALKRNTGERDENNIERVDGVGASSQRVALLSGVRKESRKNSEGVAFEGYRQKKAEPVSERKDEPSDDDRRRSKKKAKKHKKEKKHKKQKESHDSDSSSSSYKHRTKLRKSEFETDSRKSSKLKSHKKCKNRHKDYSSDDSERRYHSQKRRKKQDDSIKRRRHDTSESD